MKCPRCDTSILDERDRDGVTVDVCRECRGIWLDRGELEKIIARTTRELDEYSAARRRGDDDDDQRDDRTPPGGWPGGRRHDKRKRSWLESLGDIFD
jgi:Zn-finger nucleic acid-binding protein